MKRLFEKEEPENDKKKAKIRKDGSWIGKGVGMGCNNGPYEPGKIKKDASKEIKLQINHSRVWEGGTKKTGTASKLNTLGDKTVNGVGKNWAFGRKGEKVEKEDFNGSSNTQPKTKPVIGMKWTEEKTNPQGDKDDKDDANWEGIKDSEHINNQ